MNTDINQIALNHNGAALVRLMIDADGGKNRLICLKGKNVIINPYYFDNEDIFYDDETIMETLEQDIEEKENRIAVFFRYNETEKVWYLTQTFGSVYVNGHKMDAKVKNKIGKLLHGAILTLGGELSNTSSTFIFVSNLSSYLKVHPLIFTDQQAILKTLEQMKIELICPVCHDQAVAPTIFPCGHLICFSCHNLLRNTCSQDSEERCPTCRQEANYRISNSKPLNNAIRIFYETILDNEELEELKRKWQLFDESLRPKLSPSCIINHFQNYHHWNRLMMVPIQPSQLSSSQSSTSQPLSSQQPFSQSSSSQSSSSQSSSSQTSFPQSSRFSRSSSSQSIINLPTIINYNNGQRQYPYRNPFIEDDDIPRYPLNDLFSRTPGDD